MNSNCKWSEDKREEFEGKTAHKWRKPTYVSACHLDIGESPPRQGILGVAKMYIFHCDK
jgi:hypothetical protein